MISEYINVSTTSPNILLETFWIFFMIVFFSQHKHNNTIPFVYAHLFYLLITDDESGGMLMKHCVKNSPCSRQTSTVTWNTIHHHIIQKTRRRIWIYIYIYIYTEWQQNVSGNRIRTSEIKVIKVWHQLIAIKAYLY